MANLRSSHTARRGWGGRGGVLHVGRPREAHRSVLPATQARRHLRAATASVCRKAARSTGQNDVPRRLPHPTLRGLTEMRALRACSHGDGSRRFW